MSQNKIKENYKKKILELKKHNKSYYNDNSPKVSDAEYDAIKKEILDLEKKFDFLDDPNSPSKTVGFKPSKNFKKVKHKVPMLSLANAFDEEDLVNFEKKIKNYLDLDYNHEIEYSIEPKIDGISASLTYVNGNLIQGLSRGDGSEGEDITKNLLTIKDIPKHINSKDFPLEIDIRGEVFIKNNDFRKLSSKFANPRNAASGSLRQKDPKATSTIPLKFIAYTYGYEKGLKSEKQTDFIKLLKKCGFKTNPYNKKISGIKKLVSNHKLFEKERSEIEFDIDGLVYKINDFKLQKRLGFVANAPRWAIAHKFAANNAVSKITNIEIQIGRTGALTPVAKINPVNIGGVVVSNATLHNEDEINRKDIRINDTVVIERAGDVIPHVLSVDLSKRPNNSKQFSFPEKCPSCGSSTIKEFNITTKKKDAVRRCTSQGFECEKMSIEKLKHFVSKEAFNIEGLGKKIIEDFWNKKIIRYPQDIFNLNFNLIKKLEGWGNLSVSNLKYSIDLKRTIDFDRFIFSLGIRHIGLENSKLIASYLKIPQKFFDLFKENKIMELINLDGIGQTQINSLELFFKNSTNIKILDELKKILNINSIKLKKIDGKLSNKSFLITGKLIGISRSEVKSLIENNSGKILSNVNKKLDFLIIGEKPTPKKVNLAQDLDIKIITQDEFKKMLD
ncbi:NAD-dependent DNA ligase LigA [Candidatus Pelagibacter sp.]|uniref:NAD-dependent DNA ligase LigA n=1 Tax=Candidatus Pelagibacter sp. TaxID=2024849 RepID=UPI003F87B005